MAANKMTNAAIKKTTFILLQHLFYFTAHEIKTIISEKLRQINFR